MDAFLDDHRRMTRLLRDVAVALQKRDVQTAKSLARELDVVAGPHIEFEEEVLYPATASSSGPDFQKKLLSEHEQVCSGLARLLAADTEQLRDAQFLRSVEDAIRGGLKHAESCGTLVSHLETFTTEQQQQAFDRLQQLKRTPRRWTEQLE